MSWSGAVILGAILLGGCSSSSSRASAPFALFAPGEGGFSVEMPAPIRERRAREGKMSAYIAHAIDAGGTRYEIARFDLPEGLDDSARADLLARAERGLGGVWGARVLA